MAVPTYHPLLTLLPISILTGVGMLWVFKLSSDQASIRKAKKLLQAHILELRLFADSPALVWNAQKGLLKANLRYLGLMLKPALILTVPMIAVFILLDVLYGLRALEVGQAALVTVQMRQPLPEGPATVGLEAPPGFHVETPPVRALSERQISWRIRPVEPAAGSLRIRMSDRVIEKSARAGDGLYFLSSRRVGSVADWLLHPGESPLGEGTVDWVEIAYPAREIGLFGLKFHWLVWFIVLAMLSGYLLKGRFGVTL